MTDDDTATEALQEVAANINAAIFGGPAGKPGKKTAPAATLTLYGHISGQWTSQEWPLRAYETDVASIGYTGDAPERTIAIQKVGGRKGQWRLYTLPQGSVEYAVLERDGETVWDSRTAVASMTTPAEQTVDDAATTDIEETAVAAVTSAPDGLTETSPGQTARVAAIVAKRTAAAKQNTELEEDSAGVDFVVDIMSADEAREVTDRIRSSLEEIWELIVRAYSGRAWVALDYESWTDYCATEFGSDRLRLPREERTTVVSLGVVTPTDSKKGPGVTTRNSFQSRRAAVRVLRDFMDMADDDED